MRFAVLLMVLAAVIMVMPACQTAKQPEAAYHVDATGAVSTAARSALNGSTAPGTQEIIGVYIPFIGTGLAIKAGLEWDGAPGVITIPVNPAAATNARTVGVPLPGPRLVPLPVPRAAGCQ